MSVEPLIALDDEIDARLRQLEHFAEIGRLSASLLHEISNPLTAALIYLESQNEIESLNIKQARRNIILLQRYVEAARQQVRNEGEVTNFFIRQQIDQVRRVVIPLARSKGVDLKFEISPNFKIYGDPVKFQHIVANLIINAIDSYEDMPLPRQLKRVTIDLENERQWLVIRVLDRGKGIAKDQLENIFDAFYSTKNLAGKGLGIGLTAVKQYVENDFSGSIKVRSSLQKGTQFIAKLRLAPKYDRAQKQSHP